MLPSWRFARIAGSATVVPAPTGTTQNSGSSIGIPMLNQHRHTVIPESDHLRIGDCVLDLPRREITHGDATMRITVKSLQVLLVLVSQQGKVVSREALIEWVWADTMPSDDVLTQAITQLRKAFCDDRDSPRYVEIGRAHV